ncbi:MAG: AAA family ATPase [Bacteroidales bacterium]|jgi:predicted ATPase
MTVQDPLKANLRYVITGGPGSGKTTLVEALKNLGYTGFPEIARDLIQEGITPPIWSDKPVSGRFFELILEHRISSHQQIKSGEIAFYDRGIPDSLAYLKFQNKKIPRFLIEAVDRYRYNTIVFAAPPWEDIFAGDSVRRESYREAGKLFELAVHAYAGCGYRIIELPRVPLEQRVEQVIRVINKGGV